MNFNHITTMPVAANEARLVADRYQPQFDNRGERYNMATRAQREFANILGLKPDRMLGLAASGGIDIADQLRGSNTTKLFCGVQGREIVAVSPRPTTAIEGDAVLNELLSMGYEIPMRRRADGYFEATCLNSDKISIGNDIYRAGIVVDVDLAGHQLPTVDVYVERQICSNGQAITISEADRRVPLHQEADGMANARSLLAHVAAWQQQGVPEHILNRLSIAAQTPASISEVISLRNITTSPDIVGLRRPPDSARRRVTTIVDDAFGTMLGSYQQRLGVASFHEIPKRDRRFLASETSVAGLINLATELASHHVDRQGGSSRLSSWWNTLMNSRYDLEGIATTTVPAPARWLGRHNVAIATN